MSQEYPDNHPAFSTSHPTFKKDGKLFIRAYDAVWPYMSDISLELACYRLNHNNQATKHMVNAYHLIWPSRKASTHQWTLDRMKAHCEGHRFIGLAGSAASAKSHDFAVIALIWWWANPSERTVIICSTTLTALKTRIWSYITELRYLAPFMPGRISNSMPPKMMFSLKDPKHGILTAPLKEGKADKTLADLIGIHPTEAMLVGVDESTDVTAAVIKAADNWEMGIEWFQMWFLGNSKTRGDTHGGACEHEDGWGAIDPDTMKEWPTKIGGICLFSDGLQSPAIKDPDPVKRKLLSKFLINADQVRLKMNTLGADHPQFWRFVRGYWPPEDATRTVLTRTMTDKHRTTESCEFGANYLHKIASLDPAFTSDGDACILRFGYLGTDAETGKMLLDYGGDQNVVKIQLEASTGDPITYQIVKKTMIECQARGIPPENLAVDVWGMGVGARDVFKQIWSDQIHFINSVGSPSDNYVDVERVKSATEVYDRRVTELWMMMREFVIAGQIRGMDEVTLDQYCRREWEQKGKKVSLESKGIYKERNGMGEEGGSPDEGDAAAYMLDLARERFGFTPHAQELHQETWQDQWLQAEHSNFEGFYEEDEEDLFLFDAFDDTI